MVFVAEDIRKHCMLNVALIGDKTHGNTCHRLLHLHTGIEQSKRTGTHCCHRRRAVRLEDIRYNANCVREVFGEHTLKCTVCQIAVTDFTTAYTTLCLGFAS